MGFIHLRQYLDLNSIYCILLIASIAFVPTVNRFLDRITSNKETQDLFELIKAVGQGEISKEELITLMQLIKNYLSLNS